MDGEKTAMSAASSTSSSEASLWGLSADEAAAVEWVRCMVRDSEGKRVRCSVV